MTHDAPEGKSTPRGVGEDDAARTAAPVAPEPAPEPDPRPTLAGDLPLAEYVCGAVTAHNARERLRRIRRGPWESPLWYFLRLVKAHDELAPLDAGAAYGRVHEVVAAWGDTREAARRPDPWRCWLGVSREDAEVEFLNGWGKVRYLPGATPLDNAMHEATLRPLAPAPHVATRRSAGYSRFVSLAGHLQVVVGAQPIYLPSREVAATLGSRGGDGVSHTTVTQYVKWAVEDEYLRPVEAHTRSRAARYVFAVERFDCLLEIADPRVMGLRAVPPPS